MPPIVGLDLGTTNTCAAQVVRKIPRVIPVEGGYNTMPSVVTFHPNGSIYVGQAARELGTTVPQATISEVKRLVGRPFDSRVVAELQKRTRYDLIADAKGETTVRIGGSLYDAVDVQARILMQMKRYVEINLGEEVQEAVIAVPAYFNQHQRDLVLEAGERGGWKIPRLVNEPTAAALAYGFNRNLDQRLLVYDLGGGTFDVSILEIRGNVFEVIASGGDVFLGGSDFDDRILRWIVAEIRKQAKIDSLDEPVILQRLRAIAERAKIELSVLANTQIRVPSLIEKRGRPISVELVLDRETLNRLTGDLVARSLRVVNSMLQRHGISKPSIDEIVLVGGQTRMPLVIDGITADFDRQPRKGVNPDESIALGAALVGDALGEDAAVTLVDKIAGTYTETYEAEPREDAPIDAAESRVEAKSGGFRDLMRNVFRR
ncbi:MAG: Hsp70 family protein [Clostridia bacterium]|nr:Hsp70 family protein [Deltaproteobacteria bacterium]